MATSPTSSVAERVVQQRQYGRTQPVVVEATPDGLAYRRAGSPDGADLSRGVTVSFGLCRERPRVLFGDREAWWFFLHPRHHHQAHHHEHGAVSAEDVAATVAAAAAYPLAGLNGSVSASAASAANSVLHLAADSAALRAEWRDHFESLSTTPAAAAGSLKKAGVLWMRRKEDTDWVRHYVVASGHSLEWLAMEGKLKEIAYGDMRVCDDGDEVSIAACKDAGAAAPARGLRLSDFQHPLVISSRQRKRRLTFLFESCDKLSAWSELLQTRIAAAAQISSPTHVVGSSSGGRSLLKGRKKKAASSPTPAPRTLFDPAVEETLERTALRNSIRDDCERAKAQAGKTPFGLLWDMHNPDDIRRIEASKKAAPSNYYRILSLDGGGLRAILECVILERILECYPDFIERVDLFAGVSGGSMVCCGLACGYSPNFIRSCFEQHGEYIVPQRVAFNDDGKRNLAGIGAKARYPNHNFRIVGAELLQNLPLRDVPNHLLIPSFLLDNGSEDAIERSWEPRVYHNIPCKADPYARSRRSSPRGAEKAKQQHHFGLFSWPRGNNKDSAATSNGGEKRLEKSKKTKTKTTKRTKTKTTGGASVDYSDGGRERALSQEKRSVSDCDDDLARPAPLRRGLSSDDVLAAAMGGAGGVTDPAPSTLAGEAEEKKTRAASIGRPSAGVKKLWKTLRDDRDKTAGGADGAGESPEGNKAKEAKGERRVRRAKRLAQWVTLDASGGRRRQASNSEAPAEAMIDTEDKADESEGEVEDEEEVDIDQDEDEDGDGDDGDVNETSHQTAAASVGGDDGVPLIAEDAELKAPAWDYVMASAAAPIQHIDAGIMSNGPALMAAVTVMGANVKDPQRPENICVMSLGTGMVNKFIDGLEQDWGLLEWRTKLPELMFKAKDLLSEQMCSQLLGERYHRVNPWLRKKVAMDDPSVIPQLVALAQSADLTETLEWVGRYFYSEDELEERREALQLGKQQVPHQQTEPISQDADTCGLCSSSEAKAVAAQSHREQQEHQCRLLHNEKQEALAQLDRDEDAAAAAEYGELADA